MGKNKKQEAIRLRIEEKLSLRSISEKLKISISTASLWLKGMLLTESRLAELRKEKRPRKTKTANQVVNESKFHKLFHSNQLTKAQKAQLAEAAVLFRLVLYGFEPMTPVFDGDKMDWAVRRADGQIKTIQVKYARRERKSPDHPRISLRHSAGRRGTGKLSNYVVGDFDYIVGYDYLTDVCYVYSWFEVSHLKSSVSANAAGVERWDKINVDVV